MGNLTRESCCALVVTYHPTAAVLDAIATARLQCAWVLVIDNGSDADELMGLARVAQDGGTVDLVRNKTNVGLAAALNQGCRLAVERGFEWILFLDQDTQILPNMVADLMAAWRSHPEPHRVGVIGSNYYDDRGQVPHQRMPGRLFAVVPFVVTSGSMARLSIFTTAGPFRDDFFIDWIDIEYCYRLAARGLQTLRCLEPAMRHMWGAPSRVRLFGVEVMATNHSPLRRYFIVRNGVYVLTRYAPRFPIRCGAQFAHLLVDMALVLFLEREKWTKAKAMAVGFWHGIFGRLGLAPRFLQTT